MDILLNPLSDPALWSGVVAEIAGFHDQRISYHDSTALRFTPEHNIAACAVEAPIENGNYIKLAFNISSHDHPCALHRESDATYRLWVGESYFTFSVPQQLSRVTLPITGAGQIKLEALHGGNDYVVISDLRIVSASLPADLLESVKVGIERHIRSPLTAGQVSVKAGDREITFADEWEWLERNVVIRLGNKRYQIKNYANNTASLGYTYNGNVIQEDFEGIAVVETPVEIGYYDREADLPGIALWYNAPIPTERHAPGEYLWCIKDGAEMYMKRNGTIESWRVSIEVAAHSPELVSIASRAVRAFLAEYTVWCHGNKLWFNWKEPTADTEPVEDFDIVPRALYQIDVEIEEDLWPERILTAGTAQLTARPMTSQFPKF
jgi:hypothetical protein